MNTITTINAETALVNAVARAIEASDNAKLAANVFGLDDYAQASIRIELNNLNGAMVAYQIDCVSLNHGLFDTAIDFYDDINAELEIAETEYRLAA